MRIDSLRGQQQAEASWGDPTNNNPTQPHLPLSRDPNAWGLERASGRWESVGTSRGVRNRIETRGGVEGSRDCSQPSVYHKAWMGVVNELAGEHITPGWLAVAGWLLIAMSYV